MQLVSDARRVRDCTSEGWVAWGRRAAKNVQNDLGRYWRLKKPWTKWCYRKARQRPRTMSRGKITAGELRVVKVGNRNRIPFEEFERFWQATMGDLVELTRDDIAADLFGDR